MLQRRFALILFSVVGVSSMHAAEPTADNWITRERIRAGWIYHGDGIQQIQRFKDYGLNALITHAGNPEQFDQWARESRRVGIHLFGVLGFSFDAQKAGMRRAVFGNGYESVVACPTDEKFWQEQMTERAVHLAREGMTREKEISGILIDFELYANDDKGGQIYYTDACYCDACFGAFLKARRLPSMRKSLPFGQRVQWLKDKGLYDAYHPFLQSLVRACAQKIRQSVEAVRKDFYLGFYPRPHNWMLVGVAQGLGSPKHPMILWATDTYGGGGPKSIPDWRQELQKQDIHAYYCAGMLLRFYSAANLAPNIYHCALKGNGYWLFTVHTLCIPVEQQSGDYYLSAGTPEEYLNAIKRANVELDKRAANPNYQSSLAFVEEPVRYRDVGYDVGRFKVPALDDRSQVERGKEFPLEPLPLTGSQYLLTQLKAGEDVAIRFHVDRAQSGDVWGVSYAVLDPEKNRLDSGRMPPGEEFTVRWKASRSGLHTLVLTPGYYGRCTAVASTRPFALSTQGKFEVSQPGGRVYFHVPKGMESFEISAQCHWGTTAAQLTVCTPDGAVAAEHETDPFVRSVRFTVPTGGKTDKMWSLTVAGVPKKAFRSLLITFDRNLPPCVTLSPRFVFVSAGSPSKKGR